MYDNKGNIIYEIKNGAGIIKEYNYKDKLIFEGEYLNGKRNGKGKEYNKNDGNLLFEGEYLNGEKNGKGKEYNNNGNVIFEGIYLNGKRSYGKGIENNKKILLFNGKYLNEDNIKMELE